MLSRVPEEHLAWKPHEKSMSLGRLAQHIVDLFAWMRDTALRDRYDLAEVKRAEAGATPEAMLAEFEQSASEAREAVGAVDAEALLATWTLVYGAKTIAEMPRLIALRTMSLSHIIHHRGQLTVYLRLLGVPLPPTYGPTADDRAGF